MRLGIRWKIVVITAAILFLTTGADALVSSAIFTREYSEALQARALVIAQGLKLKLDRLLALNIPLSNLEGFGKQCQEIVATYPDMAYAMVLDFEGEVLYHNDPAQEATLVDAATRQAVQSGREILQLHGAPQAAHYDVITPVWDSYGNQIGAVRIGFPARLIDQKKEMLLASSAGIAVVSLSVAVALLVLALSVWVTRPLMKLLAAMHKIRTEGAGSTRRVTIDSRDEVGQLGSAFNQLIEELNASQHELRQYTQSLEMKVAERTAELTATNERLQLDIAERRQAEAALRRSEERFQLAAHATNDVIWDWDLTTDTIWWNDQIYSAFGYRPGEVLSTLAWWSERLHPDDHQRVIDSIQTVFDGFRHSWSGEYRYRRGDGTYAHVLDRGYVTYGEDNRPVRMIGAMMDITDRKQAEVALRQAKDAAEDAARAKSEFLANMSHEIRTPMNAVIGMTGLLLDTPLSPDQREFVETIRNGGDTLLAVINDILDFSKIEAGKLELEQQPFSLRTCIEESLDLLAPRAAEKQLELVYSIDAALPDALIGDVTRLRQVLVNLLSNAVKFTERGEVVVEVQRMNASREGGRRREEGGENFTLHPSSFTPAPERIADASAVVNRNFILHPSSLILHFSVRDTGIGIPADRLDELFQSFSQVDASTTRRYGGTGLGLVISKRLCELMGGTIWVESEFGRGSTFYFTIAAQPAMSPSPVETARPWSRWAGKRVLIVDDSETHCRILARQLQDWGLLPHAVTSGRDALACLAAGQSFDAAILDMHMPSMDEPALAAEIDKRPAARSLPLILLTAIGRSDQAPQTTRFAATLTKPVKQSQLLDALTIVFDAKGTRAADPLAALMPSHDWAADYPLRILVVEDNAVNQKVTLRILGRLGYRADVAANGLEALDALRRQPYDVVLMDVQMPEMDGLEATRRIRQQWPAAQQPRIVAMTANAMQGDRERCLDAGMDDYVSKPVRIEELVNALVRSQVMIPRAQPSSRPEPGTLDSEALTSLRALAGPEDGDVLRDLVSTFFEDARHLMDDIRSAVAHNRAPELQRAAHTLKSTSASLGAQRLSGLCLELEMLGRQGLLRAARDALPQLDAEFERVQLALTRELEHVPA